jgi:hypothetical protein
MQQPVKTISAIQRNRRKLLLTDQFLSESYGILTPYADVDK